MKRKVGLALLVVAVALSLGLVAAPVGASTVPGLVGLWHLDESSGTTAYDSTVNGNDGTLLPSSSPPIWVYGKFGKALSFDGDEDCVQLPASNSILNTNTFTVEAWFRTSVNHVPYGGNEGRIVNLHWKDTESTAVSLYVEQGKIGLLYHPGSMNHQWVKYDVNYYDHVWHHIAVTYDATTYKLYYDGSMVKSEANSFGGFGTYPGYLGTYNSSGRFFDGLIDEVRIWNIALTADQIALSAKGSVTWLPPVTNDAFILKDGTTLPLKFQISENGTLVNSQQPVFLEVAGPVGFTTVSIQLGEGVESLRWNADECYYIANLKTKDGNWPAGEYTATVIMSGVIINPVQYFYLSAVKGVGRGNSGKT